MKNLKEYVKEGLFDDLDKIEGKNSLESNAKQIKKEIENWICSNYYYKLSCPKSAAVKKRWLDIDMSTSPPTVNYNPDIYDAKTLLHLQSSAKSVCNDGLFQWGKMNVKSLTFKYNIEDLIGLPEEFDGHIRFESCHYLKDLKGCPKKISKNFTLLMCRSITDFTDGPEEVGDNMYCSCIGLESLKGFPKKVGGHIFIGHGKKLPNSEIEKIKKKFGDQVEFKDESWF